MKKILFLALLAGALLSTAYAGNFEEMLVTVDSGNTIQQIENTIDRDIKAKEISDDTVMVKLSAEEQSELAEVADVQPNFHYYLDEDSSEESADKKWNYNYMDVNAAWNFIEKMKPSSSKVKIAMIDTGINGSHEDLQANFPKNKMVKFNNGKQTHYTNATYGHGTSVGGILGATAGNGKGTIGMATGRNNSYAEIWALDVFKDYGYEAQCSATTADIVSAIGYAESKGADIISMSMGHNSQSLDANGNYHDDVLLKKAIDEAVNKYGILVCCSGGNKNTTSPWYPSDWSSVVGVINTEHYDNAWGKCKYSRSNYGSKKNISAPGQGCYTTSFDGGYKNSGGTSAATPMVAATAALCLYVNPKLSVSELKNILYSTTTDLYTTGFDNYTAYGNVNTYNAVKKAAKSVLTKSQYNKIYKATKPVLGGGAILKTPSLKSYKKTKKTITLTLKYIGTKNVKKNYIDVYRKKSGEKYSCVRHITGLTFKDTGLKSKSKYYYRFRERGTTTNGKKAYSSMSKTYSITTN